MKKMIFIAITLCCISQLASCSKSKNSNAILGQSKTSSFSLDFLDTESITDSDFNLYSYDSSISIHKGDTIEEIKNKLDTSSLDKYGDHSLVQHQGIILCVRDEKYCEGFMIQPYDKESTTFKTLRNIKIGSTFEHVKVAYGEPTMIINGDRLVIYVYKQDGNKYFLLKEGETTEIATEYHYVQFLLNSDGIVSTITVGDFDFTYNRK